jgi:hypothetical protein
MTGVTCTPQGCVTHTYRVSEFSKRMYEKEINNESTDQSIFGELNYL